MPQFYYVLLSFAVYLLNSFWPEFNQSYHSLLLTGTYAYLILLAVSPTRIRSVPTLSVDYIYGCDFGPNIVKLEFRNVRFE